MKYKGYIKLEHEVVAENEEQAKEKIADYWDDELLVGFDSSSVELESENKGEWIEIERGIKCSKCGAQIMCFHVQAEEYNFCPNCGADMRGKAE